MTPHVRWLGRQGAPPALWKPESSTPCGLPLGAEPYADFLPLNAAMIPATTICNPNADEDDWDAARRP
jgi:hypothetical protein